jgi:anti-anti-sigma factor
MSTESNGSSHARSLASSEANSEKRDSTQNAMIHDSRAHGEVLQIFGEVDLSNVGELREAIGRAAAGGGQVVVDLTTCTFLDSSILSALVRASETYSGRFHIVVPPGGVVHRVFSVTSLLGALPVVESIEAAGV